MKSLTSKAVPPDRRLPNQLHGWLAKSALNPTSPSSHLVLAAPKSSLFSALRCKLFILGTSLSLPVHPCSYSLENKSTGVKERRAGSERRDEVDAQVSLSRIRKQRMSDWLDGETSRGRDRGTGLNKQRSGWWCRK